jgi:hypothetical protein
VEVYAPIPEEVLHRAPAGLRKLGSVVVLALIVVAAALVLRFAFEPTPPMFENYGVLQTSLGPAVVACGGEVTGPCGETTALVFRSCDAVEANFPGRFTEPERTDRAVRELTGKRPPSGSQWSVACGHDGLRRDTLADLDPA